MPKKKDDNKEEKKPKKSGKAGSGSSGKAAKAKVEEVVAKRVKKTPSLLRGFRDILPEKQPYWDWVRNTATDLADAYSFGRIELPVLERVELFVRTIGKKTDIIEKEMYHFEDQAGDKVALRPEATASIARAYINHGMLNKMQPVKMFYMGPMLRHDRPQAGRYRQFNQFGFESIGSDDAIVDAQLIVIAYQFFKELGLDVTMQINSIGIPETRKEYEVELTSYFRQFRSQFSDTDKSRLQKNPLRLLDSKEEYMTELLENAPQIIDWLDEPSKNHFMQVLEYLDAAEVPYMLNPYLVRGLDYYSRTVFEIVESESDSEKAQNALGGGGRYDSLIEQLGGREETPACGFAIGMERVVNALEKKHIEAPQKNIDVFFAQLGDAARRSGLKLFEELRSSGLVVSESFAKGSLKTQLELANKLEASYTLILGQKEVLDETIIIRDMDSGAQEIVDVKKVVSILKKQLEAKIG